MRILFAGTPEPALPSLRLLLDSSHDIVAVLTRPDAPAGRGRTLRPSPVRALAQARGLHVLTPDRPSDPAFQAELERLQPDVAAVVAYGGLIRQRALDVPRHGWINLHFSVLPAWRGAAPVQHALIAGDDIVGASTFRLERGLDTGPVYGTLTEPVRPADTAGDLLERLADAGAHLLLATLAAIADGTARPQPQPENGVSLAPKLTVDDAHVRWHDPAQAVDRRIRGCTPEPGAWTSLDGVRIGLGPVTLTSAAAPGSDQPDLAPGELRIGRREVLVGTGTEPVRLGSVRPAGKRAMAAADWARGLHQAVDHAPRFDS
jgi:methionyl-tRNA formyltransferase